VEARANCWATEVLYHVVGNHIWKSFPWIDILNMIFILFCFIWKMGTHISAYLEPGFYSMSWNEQDSEAYGKSRVVGTQILRRVKTFFFFFLVFWDRVSLCSPGCPRTHSVDQAGLELRNLPASASQVLGLKACATTPSWVKTFIVMITSELMPKGWVEASIAGMGKNTSWASLQKNMEGGLQIHRVCSR
jgi:hypothetical protein